jgi:hypothetical protein
MNINVIYGEGAANNAAPAGFYAAVNYVVSYLDSLFTNNVTININISYGFLLDPYTNTYSPMSSGDLGESYQNNESPVSYSQIRNILIGENAAGSNTLPLASPDLGSLYLGSAEQKALGLIGPSSTLDGAVGISSAFSWDFSPTATPTASQYYLIGVLEHEITEVMGRVSDLDYGPGDYYTIADLYRYSSPGVHDVSSGGTGSTAYFSIDNGVTNLGSWNNNPNKGDLGDWYPSGPAPGGNDAFNDYSNPGVINAVSANDVTLMDAIGWTIGNPIVTSVTAAADIQTANINAGHVVTITVTTNTAVTVTGTPTLQLNDNEVAQYAIGSGTNSLTFIYTVQPGDVATDLQVTGLGLPNGATIQNVAAESLSGGVTGDLGLAINATIPPATTVQQEILGLYAALYNRAADFPGYSYWIGIDGQQADSGGVTVTNANVTAISQNDARVLGELFVNTQSTFFNTTYGALNDSAFINALYTNIGGNAGDPDGVAYWLNLLAQAEAGGQSVQAARAGIVGQFVHDLIDMNLSPGAAALGLTATQYQAAELRQATIDNRIAVSLAYATASQHSGGSILDPHAIGDAAYNAAVTAIQSITNVGSTADIAIAGIQLAVAQQNLLDVV